MRTQRRGLLLGTAAVAAAAHSTRLSEIVACAQPCATIFPAAPGNACGRNNWPLLLAASAFQSKAGNNKWLSKS